MNIMFSGGNPLRPGGGGQTYVGWQSSRTSRHVAKPSQQLPPVSGDDDWCFLCVDRHRGHGMHRLFGVVYHARSDLAQTPVSDEVTSWRSASVLVESYGKPAREAIEMYQRALAFFQIEEVAIGNITLATQVRQTQLSKPGVTLATLVSDPATRVTNMPCSLCGAIGSTVGMHQCSFNPAVDTPSLRCRSYVCSSCLSVEKDSFNQRLSLAQDICCSGIVHLSGSEESIFVCALHTVADFRCADALAAYRYSCVLSPRLDCDYLLLGSS